MELIYIASPYRGDVEKNIEYAKECCRYVLQHGCNFYCPHLFLPQFLDDDIPQKRELALQIGRDMIPRCDALFAFGEQISEGMRAEIECAEYYGVPVMEVPDLKVLQERDMEMSL